MTTDTHEHLKQDGPDWPETGSQQAKPNGEVQSSMMDNATLYGALSAFQAEITNPEKTKEAKIQHRGGGGHSYKYADIADVLNLVRPALAKHGLSVIQPTRVDNGQLVIETVICHSCGEHVASTYPVCNINNDHQSMGAAMTYARRYALTSMLGIAAEDDTDAQGAAKASGGNPMTSHAANLELDWAAMTADIREAKTQRKLVNWRQKLIEREGHWPEIHIKALREEIDAREREIDAQLAEQFEKTSEAELDALAARQS